MTYRWLEMLVAPFLSFDGAVVDFCSGLAALSVEEGFREGGFGFGELLEVVVSGLGLGVEVPFVDWEFILLSDRIASFV